MSHIIKGKCHRDACRFIHPENPNIKAQLEMNGRNNLWHRKANTRMVGLLKGATLYSGQMYFYTSKLIFKAWSSWCSCRHSPSSPTSCPADLHGKSIHRKSVIHRKSFNSPKSGHSPKIGQFTENRSFSEKRSIHRKSVNSPKIDQFTENRSIHRKICQFTE